jgi:hypothetical protein
LWRPAMYLTWSHFLPWITSVSAWTQFLQSEIGGSTFILNVSINPQPYQVSKPRRLIWNPNLFTNGSCHAKSAQLTMWPQPIYMKIAVIGCCGCKYAYQFWAKDDSSEIVVVQKLYNPEIWCKSCCF